MGKEVSYMVSKNNLHHKLEETAHHVPHYGLRKLSVGVASVLLGTTLYFGATAHAATDELANQGGNGAADMTDQTTDASSVNEIQQPAVKLGPSADQQKTAQIDRGGVTKQQTIAADKSTDDDQSVSDQKTESGKNAATQVLNTAKKHSTNLNVFATSLAVTPTEPGSIPEHQDANANKQLIANSGSKSVSLDNAGSKLSIDQDVLYDESSQSAKTAATLSFQTSAFKKDDIYEIWIPKHYGLNVTDKDADALDPAIGTRTHNMNNDKDYYIITDHFTADAAGTITQAIKVRLDDSTLKNFASYEKALNNIYVYKNGVLQNSLQVTALSSPLNIQMNAGLRRDQVVNHQPFVVKESQTYFKNESNEQRGLAFANGLQISLAPVDYYTPQKVTLTDNVTGKSVEVAVKDGIASFTGSQLQSLAGKDSSQFTIAVTGQYDVPDDQFKDHLYNGINGTGDHGKISVAATDLNNWQSQATQSISYPKVFDSEDHVPEGHVFDVTTVYHASYAKNDKRPSYDRALTQLSDTNYDVFENHKNEPNEVSSIRNATDEDYANATITMKMPDGLKYYDINVRSSTPFQNGDSVELVSTTGKTQVVSAKPSDRTISLHNADGIRTINIHLKEMRGQQKVYLSYPSSDSRASVVVSQNYPDGKPVQAGDVFEVTVQVTADGASMSEQPLEYTRLYDVDQSVKPGGNPDINPRQISQDPHKQSAGHIEYRVNDVQVSGDTNNYQTLLKNPIVYIEIPDNAVIDPTHPIELKDKSGRYQDVKAKSITIKTINGHTFVRVDLSNYDAINPSITVPYGNIPEGQNSSKPSAMLVWAKNIDDNYKTDHRYVNDSSTDKQIFDQLIQQDHADQSQLIYINKPDVWNISVAGAATTITFTKGNVDKTMTTSGTQDVHADNPDHFELYGSIMNYNGDDNGDITNAVQIINIPSPADGKSGFAPAMTGAVKVTDPNNGGRDITDQVTIQYSTESADLTKKDASAIRGTLMSADQVKDWSKIKSIVVKFAKLKKGTSARVTIPVQDKQVYDHVGKTIYVSDLIYSEGSDASSSLVPRAVLPGDPQSSKLTVVGKSTVRTFIHYSDADGNEHLVELPDKVKVYNELKDTMKRGDFPKTLRDIKADKALLPADIVIDFDHPTIKNSSENYVNNYENGSAAFDQLVKYDFDKDDIIFEAYLPNIEETRTVKQTIHYVYSDGTQAKPDVTHTSKKFTIKGYKNPKNNEIIWQNPHEFIQTLPDVKSPEIPGYRPDRKNVNGKDIYAHSEDSESTVTYYSNDPTAVIKYIDDTDNHRLLPGGSSVPGTVGDKISFATDPDKQISDYEKQGYRLVSNNFTPDKTYQSNNKFNVFEVHFVHDVKEVTGNTPEVPGLPETNWTKTVNLTVNYVNADGTTFPEDLKPANRTQSLTFSGKAYVDMHTHQLVNAKKDANGNWIVDKDNTATPAVQWTAANGTSFAAVTSPAEEHYHITNVSAHGDAQNNVAAITGINQNSGDQTITVTYAKDPSIKVVYVDQDDRDQNNEAKEIVGTGSGVKYGTANGAIDYSTAETLNDLKSKGYVLVSNGFDPENGKKPTYGADDTDTQVYKVVLRHDVQKVTHDTKKEDLPKGSTVDPTQLTKTITETVTYKNDDGTDFTGTRPANADQTVTFDGVEYVDKTNGQLVHVKDVDGHKEIDHDKTGPVTPTWTARDGKDSFTKVVSPNETGYHVSTVSSHADGNDVAEIKSLTKDSAKVEVTVTYVGNEQNATIKYIDDDEKNDKKKVIKSDTTKGTYKKEINFSKDPKDEIQRLENEGYVLVTDKNTWGKGDHKYQSDDKNNNYEVHFKHGTVTVTPKDPGKPGEPINPNDPRPQDQQPKYPSKDSLQVEVPREIQYLYGKTSSKAGQEISKAYKDSITFNATKVIDKVTGQVISTTWDGPKDFEDITSPKIDGYTANRKVVRNKKTNYKADQKVNKIVERVFYTPDKQTATLRFVDDTTGKPLDKTASVDGLSDEGPISFENGAQDVQSYLDQGYEFVSVANDTAKVTLDGVDYASAAKNFGNFDHNDQQNQLFIVHLKHTYTTVTPKTPGKPGEPINKDPNGTKYPNGTDAQSLQHDVTRTIHYVDSQGHTVRPDHVDHLHFTETKVIDRVTGEVISDTWDGPFDFATIDSPVIPGYTVDRASVSDPNITFNHGDIVETVVYTAIPTNHTTGKNGNGYGSNGHDVDGNIPGSAANQGQQPGQKKLPQTGNEHNSLAVAGLAMLGMTSLFGLKKKRN